MLDGLLFFPVTPFTSGGGVGARLLAEHVERGIAGGAGAVFVACGTGEFHALNVAEYRSVVTTAVAVSNGRVPVFAGAGGSVALAKEFVRAGTECGADGFLLLPPYLVRGTQEGLVSYVRDVVRATHLPTIVYQRDNVVFTPESAAELARLPQVVGFKDGIGDLKLLREIIAAIRAVRGTDFQFFNGMPTAELSQRAYRELGVKLYSSAVFAFLPEVATLFNAALRTGDERTLDVLLDEFYTPFGRLRDRRPGYAVALVKAGVGLRGAHIGGVRPPLSDPGEQDTADLSALMARALRACQDLSRTTSNSATGVPAPGRSLEVVDDTR
jgi:5-dehydro-4-deoxyglucarate dehydratase